jgi:hypothetical protein
MTTAIVILWLLLVVLVPVMLIRNRIVHRARTRRIDEISEACKQDISRGCLDCWKRRYDELDSQSYDAMLYDFRRWTYRQFYPEAVK